MTQNIDLNQLTTTSTSNDVPDLNAQFTETNTDGWYSSYFYK